MLHHQVSHVISIKAGVRGSCTMLRLTIVAVDCAAVDSGAVGCVEVDRVAIDCVSVNCVTIVFFYCSWLLPLNMVLLMVLPLVMAV